MSKPAGYTLLQIVLHWLIALLILMQYLFHEQMEAAYEAVQKGGDGSGGNIHAVTGIAVLVLAVIRIVLKIQKGSPELPAGEPAWQKMAAHATHGLLYLLMLAIPLSGMAAWGGGIEASADVHGVLTKLFLALFLLHFLGALYHRFVLKSGVMERMMRPAK
jgi:cytochrome b561